jgi:Zn-dependent protease
MRFRLVGIRVHIRPTFWLVALLIAPLDLFRLRQRLTFLAVWVAVVLASVILHELGHALTFRRFGVRSDITLYALGGFTRPQGGMLGPWQRVAVAAAGSLVGFVLGGGVWLLLRSGFLSSVPRPLAFGLSAFASVNLLWGVLNWLPIRPLDGGHIFSGLLQGVLGRRGEAVADVLFPLFTVAAGVFAWQHGFPFVALLAGFMLVQEIAMWQARARARQPRPSPEPIPDDFLFGERRPD